jgi:branched-chain amino acid transport system substrate-binding protein
VKRIIFLLIGALLVLGLVLPGCGGGGGPTDTRPAIRIGIAGPIGYAQGDNHLWGAELAQTEINGLNFTTDGVSVNGTLYKITLVEIHTNEVLDPTGADGLLAMTNKINQVDFVLGGFRTEAVLAYRGVVMAAHKLFIDCGAATEILQHSVVDDYETYKYWFKATPPNELFLSLNTGKMFNMLLMMARTAVSNATWYPRVAVIAENADWTLLSRYGAYASYAAKGLLCGSSNADSNMAPPLQGIWVVSTVATQTEMNQVLQDIADSVPAPNMIMTIMSGPCGVTYANTVGDYFDSRILSYGINVEAQRQGFPGVAKYANGMVFQDAWAPGLAITNTTTQFVSDFVAAFGTRPIYTAGTHDALKALVQAIESVGSLSAASIIPEYETQTYAGTAGLSALYPKWDGATNGTNPYYGLPGYTQLSTYALNQTQVLALYPWLPSAKYSPDGVNVVNWTYNSTLWTMAPHTTHDLIYGPGWVTGTFSQWQNISGTITNVGIWPKAWYAGPFANLTTAQFVAGVLPGLTAAQLLGLQTLGLWDQYGWWDFEYPGTGTVNLTNWVTWLLTSHQTDGTLY